MSEIVAWICSFTVALPLAIKEARKAEVQRLK